MFRSIMTEKDRVVRWPMAIMPSEAASDFKIHRRILQQLIHAAWSLFYGIITCRTECSSTDRIIAIHIAHKLSKYRNFRTKIDVGDNLPIENTIKDQCHAFFFSQLLEL